MPIARRGPGPFRPSSIAMPAAQAPQISPYSGSAGLLRALTRQLGSEGSANLFVREVLSDSGYDAVPEGPELFEVFVREEILPRILPLIRLEQMHDLVRRTIGLEGSLQPMPLKPLGSPPAAAGPVVGGPRPRVVVVEPDGSRRIQISKALVRGGFDVEVVGSAQEVLALEAFHVLVMALDAEGAPVIEKLIKLKTRAGLVTYDEPNSRAAVRDAIDRWPSDRVSLVARDVQPSTLCARVRIVVS